MSRTSIEWTDFTLNPGIYGCTPVSPACEHCYAATMARRLAGMGRTAYEGAADRYGWTGQVRVDYNAIGAACAALPKRKPARVFVTSMADLFHARVPDDFIARVFAQMALRTHLTFQVLTKRPERIARWWASPLLAQLRDVAVWAREWPPHIWIGTTVEDQRRADERIPALLDVPARVRFVSVEPLLSAVYLDRVGGDFYTDSSDTLRGQDRGRRLHWVIAGGESGPKARPTHPDWVRSLRDQCVGARVPFFFKQWGEWSPCDDEVPHPCNADADLGHRFPGEIDPVTWHVGRRAAGRLLDGRTWDEVPT